MILPQTYSAALLVMILGMLCWGSWANTFKLSGKWRFELFYFDFAVGLLVAAVIYAFTFGNLGFDGFSLADDLLHAGKRQCMYGLVAGMIFNLANMLLVAAISVAGMAVAFPVAIGLALIVGVILNAVIKPGGSLPLLAVGCVLVAAAVVVDAVAYHLRNEQRYEQLVREGKVKSTRRPTTVKGLVLSLFSGVLMGLFFPLVEKGNAGDVGLGPYSIGLLFAGGVFISTFVFNIFFMSLPVEGDPLEVRDYFRGTPRKHLLGLAGGAVWCTGGIAAFVAVTAPDQVHVGPAISYAMGQASTLIGALWGILAWKEFKGSEPRIKMLLLLMLALFACGLLMVSLAQLYAGKR